MGLAILAIASHVNVIEHGRLHPIGFAVHEVLDPLAVTLTEKRKVFEPGNHVQRRSFGKVPLELIRYGLHRDGSLFGLLSPVQPNNKPDQKTTERAIAMQAV